MSNKTQMENDITIKGEELGKSLYKILVSPKYDRFNIDQSVDILEKAANQALVLLLRDRKQDEDKN